MSYWKDFLSLIFPKLCASCSRALVIGEECICIRCHYSIPQTDFHKKNSNPVEMLFRGQANIESAFSYYFYEKDGSARRLVRKLKYEGREDIGIAIGKFYGAELLSEDFKYDMIIPVPLHSAKQNKRGYNQSECFAKGLSKIMQIPINTKCLFRTEQRESQTTKDRIERWENIKGCFDVINKDELRSKHILLVDDVVTTGATLSECANELLSISGVKISIGTIAYAKI